ncbi:betaine/proline/choline family ABC transporter ATP-binding protein [Paraliobacillus zengyii]|uniref:betaine/proline/choline family ABC transporter ATP-binding protein n=1 Tax=Paraliobacillus zengyii TaxID=2213194 RepID=UPI000DD2FDC7|nr:betaine/proline/choline family ABC transporter ATP-binding protein [Paraliobacillus zengyii]
MIQLKQINKVYDDGFQALKNIDLTFEEGKINVLIGPSGCGKTTTMKLLNKLTEHTDGQILIDDKDINDINPIQLRRQMGYVIQSIGLFPHMTIYDNVATVPKLLKWDKSRTRKRVEELLNMVDLAPETYMKRYPSELSGGQQQRIGVIRALAAEPSTILMDEPFSALDPISREQLQDELVRLQKEIKKTIVFVTHDMDEAIKIADQIILMKGGEIVQKGSPEEILTNPVNDFVKEFIGSDRLGKAKKLPSLAELLVTETITLSPDLTMEKAIEEMVANNVAELPVVDGQENYLGVLSLYKALANKEARLSEIVDNSVITIYETTDLNLAMGDLSKSKSIIPVLSEDKKFVGIIENSTLFKALHQIYESKSGVA